MHDIVESTPFHCLPPYVSFVDVLWKPQGTEIGQRPLSRMHREIEPSRFDCSLYSSACLLVFAPSKVGRY